MRVRVAVLGKALAVKERMVDRQAAFIKKCDARAPGLLPAGQRRLGARPADPSALIGHGVMARTWAY
jgi:hypothetical protein